MSWERTFTGIASNGTYNLSSTVYGSFGGHFIVAGITTESEVEVVNYGPDMIARDMAVNVGSNAKATTTTFRLRVNGADTGVFVDVGAGVIGVVYSATPAEVWIRNGDRYCLKIVHNGANNLAFGLTMVLAMNQQAEAPLIASGNITLSAASATTFIGFGGASNNVVESSRQFVAPEACTISDLQVQVVSNGRTTDTLFTLRVNGSDFLTVTVTGGTTGTVYVSGSKTISASDLLCFAATTGSGSGSLVFRVIACRYISGTANTFLMVAGIGGNASSSTTNAGFFSIGVNTTEGLKQLPVPVPCSLTLFGHKNTTNSATSTTTVSVRLNGANGNNAVSIPSTSTGFFSDTTPHTDTFVVGDLINAQGAGMNANFNFMLAGALVTVDATVTVTGDDVVPVATSANLVGSLSSGLGLMGTTASNAPVPSERLALALMDRPSSVERLALALMDRPSSVERLALALMDRPSSVERLVLALMDRPSSVERLVGQLAGSIDPIEWSGSSGTTVSGDDLVPMEILSLSSRDTRVPEATSTQVLGQTPVPEAILGASQSSVPSPVEWSGTTGGTVVFGEDVGPIEWLGTVVGSPQVQVEVLGSVLVSHRELAELLTTVMRDIAARSEILALSGQDTVMPAEWLGTKNSRRIVLFFG